MWAQPVAAMPPVPAEGTVSGVSVEGPRRIEEAAVLAAIGLRKGEELTPEKVRRDLRSVYALGFFDDVVVETLVEDDGVRVVFLVEEKPSVREVKIEGEKKIDEDDIREALDVRAFNVLNEATLRENRNAIRDLYVEKGYYLVDIDVTTEVVGDDQVDVVFNIKENRKVLVQRVDFTGNDHIPSSKIKRFMQIREGGFVPWLTSSGTFKRELLDADKQTVAAVFLEEGYIDVQVDPPKVYLSPDKRYIFISYHIVEGEQYDIGALDAVGDFVEDEGLTQEAVMQIIAGRQVADVQEEQWRDAEERNDRLFAFEREGSKLTPGEVFRSSSLQMVRASIESFYQDQGYAFVNVVPLTDTHVEERLVDVTFQVEKGEKFRIGKINITGNQPTFDKVVRREIQIVEGDIYRGSLIRASQSRLERLGFFDEVNISTPRGDGRDVLDFNVQVSEQPTGSFSLGMGYSNLESVVITANMSKNNFLGLGYVMSAAINYSKLRKQGNLSFLDPYFLDTRWTFKIDFFSIDRQFQRVYQGQADEFQRGGSFGVGRYLDKRDDMQLRVDYTIEDVGLNNIDAFRKRMFGGDLYRNGLTSTLGLSFNVDKRNNRIFATQGLFASASTALSGGLRLNDDQVLSLLGGDFNFIESKVNVRYFQPLIPNTDQLVFRVNATFGHLASTDGRIVPFIHRFRAGGINSVRGYNWYSLGPTMRLVASDDPVRADDKIPVGGNQIWVNNIEIEQPIVRSAGINGVVFFDAGNAFGDPLGIEQVPVWKYPSQLRFAYGMGVRWRSPIGPLRFEYGIPVAPRDDERRGVFDFSIGSFF
jgi:outer membrane protein insertion porin family